MWISASKFEIIQRVKWYLPDPLVANSGIFLYIIGRHSSILFKTKHVRSRRQILLTLAGSVNNLYKTTLVVYLSGLPVRILDCGIVRLWIALASKRNKGYLLVHTSIMENQVEAWFEGRDFREGRSDDKLLVQNARC